MRFILQTIVLGTVMLVSCLLGAETAQAETIPFDGGEIIYDKGSLDRETYNGTIRGVVFRFDNGEEAYADLLRIETSRQESPPRIIIDHFEITNFNMADDSTTMALSLLKLRDTVIDAEDGDLWSILEQGGIENAILQVGHLVMAGVVFDDIDEGNLTVDTITLKGYTVDIDGVDTIPLQAGGLEIKDFVYIPTGDEATGMKNYGFDRITMKMTSSNTVNDKPDRVEGTTYASIDLDDIGTISMELDIGLLKGSLLAIGQYAEEPENDDDLEYMMMVFSGIFINSAEISITDAGMLPIIFDQFERQEGTPRAQAIEQAMNSMALTIGPFAPRTYAAFAPAMNSFLNNGGKLSLTIAPYTPVPMTSFMSFMAAPDTALSVLGMKLRQSKQ